MQEATVVILQPAQRLKVASDGKTRAVTDATAAVSVFTTASRYRINVYYTVTSGNLNDASEYRTSGFALHVHRRRGCAPGFVGSPSGPQGVQSTWLFQHPLSSSTLQPVRSNTWPAAQRSAADLSGNSMRFSICSQRPNSADVAPQDARKACVYARIEPQLRGRRHTRSTQPIAEATYGKAA